MNDFELKELIDKATPKKVLYERETKRLIAYTYRCTVCKEMLSYEDKAQFNYCPDCGQALDWDVDAIDWGYDFP